MISDLNLYKVFYIVSKCKNISHAAKKLFISQPAVSKSIKSLEHQLNVTLFYRNSKGVSLTKEGEILFEFIEKAYKEVSSGEDIIKKLLNKEIGIGTNNFRVLLVTAKESDKSLVYNNLTNPITIFTDIIVSRETIIMKHSQTF